MKHRAKTLSSAFVSLLLLTMVGCENEDHASLPPSSVTLLLPLGDGHGGFVDYSGQSLPRGVTGSESDMSIKASYEDLIPVNSPVGRASVLLGSPNELGKTISEDADAQLDAIILLERTDALSKPLEPSDASLVAEAVKTLDRLGSPDAVLIEKALAALEQYLPVEARKEMAHRSAERATLYLSQFYPEQAISQMLRYKPELKPAFDAYRLTLTSSASRLAMY